MKGNVHFVNLQYGDCVVYRYKTHVCFVTNKMDGYLQFSTKSTAKVIPYLSFRMQEVSHTICR